MDIHSTSAQSTLHSLLIVNGYSHPNISDINNNFQPHQPQTFANYVNATTFYRGLDQKLCIIINKFFFAAFPLTKVAAVKNHNRPLK